MDVNTYYRENLRRLIAAAERAKNLEADPVERHRINWDIALMSADLAAAVMANGFDFPETPARFEDLLVRAAQDVAKRERLAQIFDKAVEGAGAALEVTQRVVGLLAKYGKYLALI